LEIEAIKHPGSFRDPSGFLYYQEGVLYRAVNPIFKEHYDHLIDSGLYQQLTDRGLLISHEEIEPKTNFSVPPYKVLKPERLPFISYPYEWCFSQLKEAALATTTIHKMALEYGMELKDAGSFNIQFLRGKPILIDTLSLQKCSPGTPWIAYRQFCQHFLAPLALMAYKDVRLSQLMKVFIDGLPLDLAGKLLPSWTYLKPGLLLNIHLHAMITAWANYQEKQRKLAAGKQKREKIVETPDVLLQWVNKANTKLIAIDPAAWTEAEKTAFDTALMDLKKTILALLKK
jgi:hypothetical protein